MKTNQYCLHKTLTLYNGTKPNSSLSGSQHNFICLCLPEITFNKLHLRIEHTALLLRKMDKSLLHEAASLYTIEYMIIYSITGKQVR